MKKRDRIRELKRGVQLITDAIGDSGKPLSDDDKESLCCYWYYKSVERDCPGCPIEEDKGTHQCHGSTFYEWLCANDKTDPGATLEYLEALKDKLETELKELEG